MTEKHTIEITRSKDGKFKTTKKIATMTPVKPRQEFTIPNLVKCIVYITGTTFVGVGIGMIDGIGTGYLVMAACYFLLFLWTGFE